MKKILALLLVIAMMLALVACTKTNNNEDENKNDGEDTEQTDVGENTDGEGDDEATEFDYMAEDLTQYLTLGKYEGLEATLESSELTDEEFEEFMNSNLMYYSTFERIFDRPVEEGDTVIIDYSGEMDGETFGGGTATDVELVAADGNGYIPGFGSSLVGHTPGEKFDINISFPDPYPNNPDLAGKPVTFHIALYCIKAGEDIPLSLDNLTDDIVYEQFDFKTVEEFIETQRASVEKQKPYKVQQEMYAQLWEQIIEDSEVIKYPASEVERVVEGRKEMYEYYAAAYEMDLETFLAQYGLTDELIREDSESEVKENLVIYSLVKALDAEVTEEEINEKIAYFADVYEVSAEEVISQYGEEQFEMTAQFDKIMAIVAEKGNITEVSGTEAAE